MEAITSPLEAVRSLYAARPAGAAGDDCGVRERFAGLMDDPAFAAQVPVLTEETADLLPNQCLVRYRGMVADMLNPEYYVGEFRRADGSWATAKYADQLDEAVPEGAETRIAERRPLLLVPVPAESPWAAAPRAAAARASLAAVAGAGAAGAAGAGKRARDGEVPAAANGAAAQEEDVSMGVSMTVSDATGQTTTADDGDSGASRARRAAAAGPQEVASGGGGSAAAPGADLPAGCCMAYLYDDREVKLNDIVEVVGVLSRVPELAAAHMQQQEGGQASSMLLDDILASHLPTSKAPRLHAILLSAEVEAAAPAMPAVAEARARALGFLSQVLGGDDVAAEYLLLQLVARVHHRTAESAVGTLALNLVAEANSPAAAAQQQQPRQQLSQLGAALAAALAALAPRCLALPLSVPALNARPWWPRRDLNTQRLVGGPLQLAANTQVLLDETVLATGTLNEVGLRNLAALQHLMRAQKVAYDFEFFSLEQPADAPVTILSLGKSLLKDTVGVALPLRPTAPLADAAAVASAAGGANLAPLRAYLAAARTLDFSIAPDMEQFLQQELAGARQKDSGVNEQTFHTWMNLARLLALSHGESGLTRERWAGMRALEAARSARLAPQAAA
ncbi:mini-chromosome maintenance complex-binding isoform A [Micractinium conductrix]|uniref:Mini-chromosome maintenance complex-binding isoform A n=1 Tax=Micractinium conductrix TaxID=554055 RepID=A0A2P6VJ76_9CHLO|nr:mini-chromosome maintenance complex-binding isoform A [Micractinium conductrix]|eukprot:PSC74128.1 mini-chromosome maintenance complex-binding isoform A [Micractinium conductrix]